MNEKPQDLKWLLLMQITGCVLVVLGHSYPFITEVPEVLEYLRTFIYRFHMPLFFWCSGYLLYHTKQVEKNGFKEYAKKRFKRLLVPYFAFSVIGLIPKIVFKKYLNDQLEFAFVPILRAFLVPRENVWGHFWFLPAAFLMGLIGYLLTQKFEKGLPYITAAAFCLSFASLPYSEWFGIADVLQYFWVFALGELSASMNIVERNHKPMLYAAMFFVPSFLLLILNPDGTFLPQLAFRFSSFGFVAAVAFFCCGIQEHSKVSRQSLLGDTGSVFILSWPCQLVAEILLERVAGFGMIITFPLTIAAGLVGPVVLIKIFDWFEKKTNTRFFSVILGRV